MFGFSDADVYFRNVFGVRQGFHSRNFMHVMKRALLTRHQKRTDDENRELVMDEKVIFKKRSSLHMERSLKMGIRGSL
jgi:hypothetical protein